MGEQNAAYLEKINRAAAAIEAACGGAEIAVILGESMELLSPLRSGFKRTIC